MLVLFLHALVAAAPVHSAVSPMGGGIGVQDGDVPREWLITRPLDQSGSIRPLSIIVHWIAINHSAPWWLEFSALFTALCIKIVQLSIIIIIIVIITCILLLLSKK